MWTCEIVGIKPANTKQTDGSWKETGLKCFVCHQDTEHKTTGMMSSATTISHETCDAIKQIPEVGQIWNFHYSQYGVFILDNLVAEAKKS